jgi:hypothetical protein
MQRRKSLFEELNDLTLSKDKTRLVEQRGENLIVGSINLIEYIESNYSETDANDLIKRLINSIRTRDPRKFRRGVSTVKKAGEDDE